MPLLACLHSRVTRFKETLIIGLKSVPEIIVVIRDLPFTYAYIPHVDFRMCGEKDGFSLICVCVCVCVAVVCVCKSKL